MQVIQGDVLKKDTREGLCFLLVLEVVAKDSAKVFCLTPCESYAEGFTGYVFPKDNDKIKMSNYKEFLDYQEEKALQKREVPQKTTIEKGLEKMADEVINGNRRKEIEKIVDQKLKEHGIGLSLDERMKIFYTKFKGALGGEDDEE